MENVSGQPADAQTSAGTPPAPKVDTAQAPAPGQATPGQAAPSQATPEASKASTESAPSSDKVDAKAAVDKYDLKLSKDSPLTAEYVAKFQLEAKERGLTSEQAQAQLDRDSGLKASFVEEQKSFVKQKADQWFEESKLDKEIGGEAFKENVELAKRGLKLVASDNLIKFLNDSGIGNNPELIRAFMKVGKLTGNDKLVTSGQTTGGMKTNVADMLFPTTKQKE